MKQIHGMDCLIFWTGQHGLRPTWMRRDGALQPDAMVGSSTVGWRMHENRHEEMLRAEQDIMYDKV